MNVSEKEIPAHMLSGKPDHREINDGRGPTPVRKILRTLLTAVIVVAGVLVITIPNYVAGKDFIAYWSAGHLLVHHADPYSPSHVLALERAQGSTGPVPNIMRNPPWALFLTVPLGFVKPLVGLFFWILATVGCVFASIRLLKVPSKDGALGYVFAPVICCILVGQSAQFLLLGFSLFLRFNRSRPFLAGVSLLFLAMKPHLFVLFWVVLLIDCVYRRRFAVLAGGASAIAAASVFPLFFDPHAWQHYFAMLRWAGLNTEVFPTVSMQIRILIDPVAVWLLFVPTGIATLWGIWYYIRSRDTWDWEDNGLLLMLVAVACSPYGWFTDETLLLPAIFAGLRSPTRPRYALWMLLTANTVLIAIVLLHNSITSRAYLWTPLVWLAWFLYSTRKPAFSPDSPPSLTTPNQPEPA